MKVFTDVAEEPQRFSLSLADVCNGISCVSGHHFSAEDIITMAGHVLSTHSTSKTDPDAALSMVVVEETDSDDEPAHGPVH